MGDMFTFFQTCVDLLGKFVKSVFSGISFFRESSNPVIVYSKRFITFDDEFFQIVF